MQKKNLICLKNFSIFVISFHSIVIFRWPPFFISFNRNNLSLGLKLYFDELIAGALTGLFEFFEVDFPRHHQAVAGDSIDRIERNCVSAGPALQGLHQSEGRIVSYSRIKGKMENRVGPAIGVKNLGRAPAAGKPAKEKTESDCGYCFLVHNFLSVQKRIPKPKKVRTSRADCAPS